MMLIHNKNLKQINDGPTMKPSKIISFLWIFISTQPIISQATELDFSMGGGYPFIATPEASIASDDKRQRWFANYKLGLDDGFSLGFEQALSTNNKHSFGILIGAVGARHINKPCTYSDNYTGDIAEEIGSVIGQAFGCALTGAFGDKTTNGVGVSYHYNFSGLNNSGWKLNFELGYGKVSGFDNKRTDGGINISYQF